MGWKEKVLSEAHDTYINKGIKYKDWGRSLKFRIRLMNFIDDWLSLDAIKTGWKMPRLQFKLWLFYKRHPYLKRPK